MIDPPAGPPADPHVRSDARALLDSIAANRGPRIHEIGHVAGRAMMVAMRDLLDAPVGDLAVIRDLACPGPAGEIALRLFDARAERAPGPVLVYFHGGGFVIGGLDTHAPICAEIARKLDLPVVSVDYRLAPEAPWPAAPDDCEAAARWIASGPDALGRKATGLVLAGDSAGGTLTITSALALRDAPAAVPVIAQWPIYPATDLETRYASYAAFARGFSLDQPVLKWFDDCYRPDPGHVRASPLKADQAGLPPTLVITAGLDPIRDQGRAYAAACARAGVPTIFLEAAGNIHGFVNMRRAIPSTEADLAACFAHLKLMIAGDAR